MTLTLFSMKVDGPRMKWKGGSLKPRQKKSMIPGAGGSLSKRSKHLALHILPCSFSQEGRLVLDTPSPAIAPSAKPYPSTEAKSGRPSRGDVKDHQELSITLTAALKQMPGAAASRPQASPPRGGAAKSAPEPHALTPLADDAGIGTIPSVSGEDGSGKAAAGRGASGGQRSEDNADEEDEAGPENWDEGDDMFPPPPPSGPPLRCVTSRHGNAGVFNGSTLECEPRPHNAGGTS